ncbi:hypothetical protein M885DRAFT_516318 [Pelagophyceae sp. CCMP2097]|nr:hypothetical protein M885DRAFT_516318 [Pelagophyceae sp. CCMP2097]
MGARHYFYWFFIILFSFFAFASRVLWIQWTTAVIFLSVMLLVDVLFTDASAFVYDPDPENWRRRTARME